MGVAAKPSNLARAVRVSIDTAVQPCEGKGSQRVTKIHLHLAVACEGGREGSSDMAWGSIWHMREAEGA